MMRLHRLLVVTMVVGIVSSATASNATAFTLSFNDTLDVSVGEVTFFAEESEGMVEGTAVAECPVTFLVNYATEPFSIEPETTFASTVGGAAGPCALGASLFLPGGMRKIVLWLAPEGLPIASPEKINGVLFKATNASFLVTTARGDACLYKGTLRGLATLAFEQKIGATYIFRQGSWSVLRFTSWLSLIRRLIGTCRRFITLKGSFVPVVPIRWTWQ